MHPYQEPDRGWCGDPRRGADMGRPSNLPYETTAELRVRQVPIVEGYDPGGTYWGEPNNLWCVWGESADGTPARYLRATDLESVRDQFPNATWAVETGPSDGDIEDMLDSYIRAALWNTNDESTPDGGKPLDENYGRNDIEDDTLKVMREDVEKFARDNAAAIAACIGRRGPHARQEPSWDLAGYHFWLERNGSGVGFEDGDWPEPEAKILTKAAEAFGRHDLYVGDDKKIHGN